MLSRFIKYLKPAFESNGTASARMLSSFVTMLMIVIVHVWWLRHAYNTEDFAYLGEILIIDYSAVGLFLGLKTWESVQIKKSNNENNNPANSDSTV